MPSETPTPRAAPGSRPRVRLVAVLLAFVAFAALLFVVRFVGYSYLAVQLDEECHIGGIAVDVLAHGIRFPLLVYVQSDYDNGSLLSGLLAAVSFTVLGRNFLALKLITHLMAAAGAVAALWLLLGCLDDLGLRDRRVRWTAIAVLVIAIALAPRVVTLPAMCTVGIGSPLDGSVINTILLAIFAYRRRTGSVLRTAGAWVLVGVAVYLNKATLPIIPVLAVVELALARPLLTPLLAAGSGFLIGVLPELAVIARQHGSGWGRILEKAHRHGHDFPWAFFESAFTLAEFRVDLLIAWALALGLGLALLLRALRQYRRGRDVDGAIQATAEPPIALAIVVGATWLQVLALAVMSQGGFDYYTIYSYATLVVVLAVTVAWACAEALRRWGAGYGIAVSAAAILVTLALYRPYIVPLDFGAVTALWHNRVGAACSWRFAEGFRREDEAGLVKGETREQHVIERCRLLSEPEQVVDCVGGMARDLQYAFNGHVHGAPPAALTPIERRAYAYYYGMRRNGDVAPCNDFDDTGLQADCRAAVQLDCLVRGGWGTRFSNLHAGRLKCVVPEPPMDGYWAAVRSDLLERIPVPIPPYPGRFGQNDKLESCSPFYAECE